jgi:hypothetical protein
MPVLEIRRPCQDGSWVPDVPNATMRKGMLVKHATEIELLNTIKLTHY